MAENAYKNYGLYLLGSFFALSLALAFPALRFDWLAILAALAFWRGGLLFSTAIIVAASFGFSAFSLHPAWQLALPLGIGLVSFSYLQGKLGFDAGVGARAPLQGILLAWIIILDKLFSAFFASGTLAAPFSWQAGAWCLATLSLGLMIPFPFWRLGRAFSNPYNSPRKGEALGKVGKKSGLLRLFGGEYLPPPNKWGI